MPFEHDRSLAELTEDLDALIKRAIQRTFFEGYSLSDETLDRIERLITMQKINSGNA